jgi:hypothetical protein
MLVLPVKIRTMAFWPILYGSFLAVCLWVFTATVIYRSSGLTIPVMMPALVMVVVVTWFQALAWIPFSVRWLRDLIGITLTLALGALPIWILHRDPGASALVTALLLVYLAAGYALAVAALKADRRGDVWFSGSGPARAGAGAYRAVRLRLARPFGSAAMAQLWYEWRCHGLAMVGFFCGLMLLIWGMVVAAGKPIEAPLFPFILGLLLTGPFVTVGSIGTAIGRFRPMWIEHRESITFLTVRPMESAGFVVAKMRMALVTALFCWAYVLAGTTLCIVLSRSLPAAITTWNRFASLYPGGRAPAICGLGCLLMPAVTWRALTSSFPFAFSGRKRIAESAVWLYLAILLGLASGGVWLKDHPDQMPHVLAIAPWVVLMVAVLKAILAATAFRVALGRRLIGWPAFWSILASWAVLTALAVALVVLLDPPTAMVSRPALFLGIATYMPLARFPLATLAFDWNRHR